ncbi:hypothetical protein AOG23_11525 [Rhizobium acidisoli]|nr:hypothetical protein AOG23_11525 [Rhizobium acidisoli]
MPATALAKEVPAMAEDWRVFERLAQVFRKIAVSSDPIADGITTERFSRHLDRMENTMWSIEQATKMGYYYVTQPCEHPNDAGSRLVYEHGMEQLRYLRNFMEALAAQIEVLATYLTSPDARDEAKLVADELYGLIDRRHGRIYRVGQGFCSITAPDMERLKLEMVQNAGFEGNARKALSAVINKYNR